MSWLETALDDDPATLQAALAMLDEMDEMDDLTESFGSPEASVDATPDDGEALEAEKPRGNVARNRQRHELLYLRDKVAQMEETLTTLKRRRATVDNGENAMVVSKSAKLWEEMAVRQLRQRRAVELENAKLQAMLRTQLKVGKDLIRLIRKSSQIYDTSSLLVQPPKVNVTSTDLSADEHFARLHQLYTLTDSVFSNLPSGENITSLRDFTTSEDDPNKTIVNSYATWTLPFPLESVLDATWRSVAKEAVKKEMNLDVAHDEKKEATITVFRWDASRIFKWLQGEVVGSMVAKKYAHHAPNEAVIITNWSATIEPVPPRIVEDMNMVEDCWMRIVQVPQDSELDTEPMTRIQINRRLNLEIVTDDTTSQRRKAGMITEFVFNQIESASNWRQETIENLIFSSKIS